MTEHRVHNMTPRDDRHPLLPQPCKCVGSVMATREDTCMRCGRAVISQPAVRKPTAATEN